jgi:predicted amidohydrolase YtcJ
MADFIVMDTDLMTVEADRIPKTRVLNTFLGGKLVYKR